MPPVLLGDERTARFGCGKGTRAGRSSFHRYPSGSIGVGPSAIVYSMTPLVTTIDDGPNPTTPPTRAAGPNVIIIFNEKSGPAQVAEIISNRHSFIVTETWETVDEQDRPAWLLTVDCES